MRTFDNEWILEAFAGRPSFFTKRMFGGLAAYLHGRQMLVLVEPTQTGRWTWHGVLVCTDHAHQAAICADFPALEPHSVLRKWLYIDSTHRDFESTMQGSRRVWPGTTGASASSPAAENPGPARKRTEKDAR